MADSAARAKRRTHTRRAFGIEVMLSGHPVVRRLKRDHEPSIHGQRFWRSSWLLMDYLRRYPAPAEAALEVGCGWGLASIWLARQGMAVTATDADPEVFPYLDAHADLNDVQIATRKLRFERVTGSMLEDIDLLVGADICFWDELVTPLEKLALRARRAGTRVVLADPGRSTFRELAERLQESAGARVSERHIERPRPSNGVIIDVPAAID